MLAKQLRTNVIRAFPVLLLFLAPALYLVVTNFEDTIAAYSAYDQKHYHLPAIRRFAMDWPRFDLKNLSLLMTPGYHLFFATIARFVTSDVVGLRLINLALAAGLVLTLAICVASFCRTPLAIVLPMPFVCSVYVFSAGVWLVTDDVAWWGVLGIFLLSLRPKVDRWTFILTVPLTLTLLSVRQIHIWVIPLLLSVAFYGEDGPFYPQSRRSQVNRLAMMLAADAPSLIMLVAVFRLWGAWFHLAYSQESLCSISQRPQ